MNLKGRSFLKLIDYTPEEIGYLIDLAAELKAKKKAGEKTVDMHSGKNIVLILRRPAPVHVAALR
jgi:ornithine carbamoyltransferase